MIKTNIALSILILILTFSCDKSTEIIQKESCDYAICEEGRTNTDTVRNAYGIFRSNLAGDYIEMTNGGYEPDTFFIACASSGLTFPAKDSYVKFSGYTKEICSSEEPMIQKDSLYLSEIAGIDPDVLYDCNTGIHNEGFDKNLVDDKLSILNMTIDKNCISILISYTGGCHQDPEFTLNNSGDVLSGGGYTFIMAVQGLVEEDCSEETIKLLKYNLSSLGEIVPIREEEYFVLFFQPQGYLRIHYPHTYR
jgi:hypothetical protein